MWPSGGGEGVGVDYFIQYHFYGMEICSGRTDVYYRDSSAEESLIGRKEDKRTSDNCNQRRRETTWKDSRNF